MSRGFDFFVLNIEAQMIQTLKNAVGTQAQGGYVKTVTTYSGELDAEQLKKALASLTPQMPLMLVSYEDGEDVESPPTAPLPGVPRVFKHDCGFAVICVSNDARGENERRASIYKMIADVKRALDCIQLKALDGSETVLLTLDPLKPAGVSYIYRLPNLTAYGVHFETYFKYITPDRTVQGPLVQELIFEVENTFEKGESNLPGVVLK